MIMSARLRKFALTVHVVSSVGFLGAVLVFFALATFAITSISQAPARASYVAMALITQLVIVPACGLSLFTGLVQSLGTTWGLLRYYWVIVKLALTLGCTIALVAHMRPIQYAAWIATQSSIELPISNKFQLAIASGLAAAALVATTALSIYKPQGLTRWGWLHRYRE